MNTGQGAELHIHERLALTKGQYSQKDVEFVCGRGERWKGRDSDGSVAWLVILIYVQVFNVQCCNRRWKREHLKILKLVATIPVTFEKLYTHLFSGCPARKLCTITLGHLGLENQWQ